MKSQGNGQGKGDDGLRKHGIIYVSGEITNGSAADAAREIIDINISGSADKIQLIINSPGGSATDGFAIVDIMEWSRLPIHTTGIGLLASMGLLIFMAGDAGRRVITPRTSILSHRYSALVGGSHSQLLAWRKEEDLMHQRIVRHYMEYSAVKDEKELERTLLKDTDTWLTPEEAVRFGLADMVEQTNRRRLALAAGGEA